MQQAVENLIPIQILFTKELLLYIQQILNHSQLYISAQCLHHLAPFEFAIRIERLINIDKQLNNLTWCISPYGIQKWHCPPCFLVLGVLVNQLPNVDHVMWNTRSTLPHVDKDIVIGLHGCSLLSSVPGNSCAIRNEDVSPEMTFFCWTQMS